MSQNYAIWKNKPLFIASVTKILEYWSLLLYFWPLLKLTQNNFPEFECVYRKHSSQHGTGCFSTNGSVFGILQSNVCSQMLQSNVFQQMGVSLAYYFFSDKKILIIQFQTKLEGSRWL